MKLQDAVKKLSEDQLSVLLYALNNEFSKMVIIDKNYFVGINIKPTDKIRIIDQSGSWSYGEINDNDDTISV